MLSIHKFYLLAAILLFLTEVIIARYVHDQFIRPFGGDFLVVIFLYCLLKAFCAVPPWKAAVPVLVFAYTIEVLQYFQLVKMVGLQDYKIARIIIGTAFAWSDLLAYTLGIIVVLGAERWAAYRPVPAISNG